MKFLYSLYGANVPVIKEFDIRNNLMIQAGEIVRCSSDGDISPASIGECVGVAAEDHSGKEDILNARANGTKLRVDITGGGVYAVPAIKLTASKTGTATTFICTSSKINNSINKSKLVLVQKGDNSTNTDSVGTERTITNTTTTGDDTTITLSNGGVSSEGDVYALVPYTGFRGNVAEDGKSFTVLTGTGVGLVVMGYDKNTACLEVLLGDKIFK